MSYDPTIGRWTTEDPAGYIDGPNEYQMERGDPVDQADPLGLATVDDWGPMDALGHWQSGDGESIYVEGRDFINTVRNIPELRKQLDDLQKDLEKKAEEEAKTLEPGTTKEVTLQRKLLDVTMPGRRWGAFGTIHHTAKATITAGKTKCKEVTYTTGYKVHVEGYDWYHSFKTTPRGFRDVWYGLNAVGGTVGSLWPWSDAKAGFHAPTEYAIHWSWDEPDPPPTISK